MAYDNYKIICVDDDLDVLDVTKKLVESLGYNVEIFSKASKAVEYIKQYKSNIMFILSDLRMDNMNGFAFKKILKEANIDIPFAIITDYWTKEMSVEAMELGIKAFIEKPVSQEVIKENIEKFGHEQADQLEEEKELILGFLEESEPMLDGIESLILELEEDPTNDQTLSVYFRLLHTIKGTASCIGLTNLGNYTHKYEDFIGELRNKNIPVNSLSTNVLLKGLDDLKVFFKFVSDEGNDSELHYQEYLSIFDPKNLKESNKSEIPQTIKSTTTLKKSHDKKEDDKMTVSMNILNDFMEESGELTVIRNSILKLVKNIEVKYRGDRDIEILNELLGSMHDVTSNIQGKITDMRQVPLKSTFRPFKRLVRDLSKKLNKQVEFEVIGEDISVDNIISKLFNNTLIHIVRNSLDHGLETPVERVALGKTEMGTLQFKVSEKGEDILLQIMDDGKGINPEFIKQKALEKKLFTEEELNQMSDLEMTNIIFASGFSTAEQVSDLSGRGVGMDMVRSSFEEMGGEVFVESKVGVGSTFNLRVPIPKSVLIITSLSVSCCHDHFIFQMDDVAEVIRYEKELANSKLFIVDDKKLISHNGEMIQIVPLQKILDLPISEKIDEVTNIVVLRVGKTKFGVEVDEIHEFEEVVSRKIPDAIDIHHLYIGASLMGSGEVSMILNAQGIAEYMALELDLSHKKTMSGTEIEPINIGEYMLFKYNKNDYLSIELENVERLETMNSAQFEDVGENIVINYLDRPLLLVDPAHRLGLSQENRFTGLSDSEDVSVIVASDSQGKQFGLLVSQLDEIQYSTEKMNTDTIDVEGLKGSVFINNKTICVINIDKLSEMIVERITIDSSSDDADYEEEFKQAS